MPFAQLRGGRFADDACASMKTIWPAHVELPFSKSRSAAATTYALSCLKRLSSSGRNLPSRRSLPSWRTRSALTTHGVSMSSSIRSFRSRESYSCTATPCKSLLRSAAMPYATPRAMTAEMSALAKACGLLSDFYHLNVDPGRPGGWGRLSQHRVRRAGLSLSRHALQSPVDTPVAKCQ